MPEHVGEEQALVASAEDSGAEIALLSADDEGVGVPWLARNHGWSQAAGFLAMSAAIAVGWGNAGVVLAAVAAVCWSFAAQGRKLEVMRSDLGRLAALAWQEERFAAIEAKLDALTDGARKRLDRR